MGDKAQKKFSWSALAVRLAPGAVALAALALFLVSMKGGFLNWDDAQSLVNNHDYRGLGRAQLNWMFTAFNMGPYTPLTWMTFGLDYLLWGMNPAGYHLTSVLLHCGGAAVFFLLARELLSLSSGLGVKAPEVSLAAAFAALVFALHPLRAESVSWLSGRHDIIATLFYCWAALAYTRARRGRAAPELWRGQVLPLALFLCALLAKGTAVTLPLALLLLDIYPLRRLPADPRLWLKAGNRGALLEKSPYFALSVIFGLIAFLGQDAVGALVPVGAFSVRARLAQALYGLGFYPLKTLAPFGLSPLYRLPEGISLLDGRVLLPAAAALLFSAGALLAAFRRLPSAAAAWAFYLLTVWPVLGAVKINAQSAADRYAYLTCLGFAALAGGALLAARTSGKTLPRRAGTAAALAVLVALSALCWRQQVTWRDSEVLWRHALALDPQLEIAHCNLGFVLAEKGRLGEAEGHYREALRINPAIHRASVSIAGILLARGRLGEAAAVYREQLRRFPDFAQAYNNLGLILADQGKTAEAVKQYRLGIRMEPGMEQLRNNLGIALSDLGRLGEAEAAYREALRLNPFYAEAHYNLGYCLGRQKKYAAAEASYRKALELKPGMSGVRNNLAGILSAQGRLEEAAAEYREALKAAPDQPEACYNLGTVLQKRGLFREAAEEYKAAIRLAPDYAEAHYNLAFTLFSLGEKEAALEHMKRALRIKPALDPRLRSRG